MTLNCNQQSRQACLYRRPEKVKSQRRVSHSKKRILHRPDYAINWSTWGSLSCVINLKLLVSFSGEFEKLLKNERPLLSGDSSLANSHEVDGLKIHSNEEWRAVSCSLTLSLSLDSTYSETKFAYMDTFRYSKMIGLDPMIIQSNKRREKLAFSTRPEITLVSIHTPALCRSQHAH